MGEPILFLRLEAPLQSWGLRARWDIRDSAREPTKSGVVGLLGAALGFARDDRRLAEELEAGLRMGVRVEREPGLLDDYHTITDFLPMAEGGYKGSGERRRTTLAAFLADPDAEAATIQSTRRYLTDASFLVVLTTAAETQPDLLAHCARALQQPYWPLYFGRRACVPTRPIFDALADQYDGIVHALEAYPWSCLGVGGERREERAGPPRRLRVILEDNQGAPRDDRRRPGSARLYGRRFVREFTVANPSLPITEGE